MKKQSRIGLLAVFGFVMLAVTGCKPSPSQMDQAIKDYFEKNPQVLEAKVEEVIKKKGLGRGAPPAPSIEEMMKNPVKVEDSGPSKGPKDAPITIVEFSEFQCPFCKRVLPTLDQLMKDYPGKIRLIFRQNPLDFHQYAMPAAKASLAANEQGKFWQMHDKLFENQQNLTDENIKKMAKEIGLNMAKFEKDWKSDKFDAQIKKDMDWARSNGAGGTPSFFINGIALKGAQPVDSFKNVINKLLEQKK